MSATRIVNGLKVTVNVLTPDRADPAADDPTIYFKHIVSLGADPAHWSCDVIHG
ncbi:hypothetical protein GXW82_06005 [Streptacidiphilus sp. 4-A2]|nr:hypothetical protein [Streptacidiphilus sp. 4-A2]